MLISSLWLPATVAAMLAAAAPSPAPVASSPSPAVALRVETAPPVRADHRAQRPLLLEASGVRARRVVAELLIEASSIDLASSSPGRLRFVLERPGGAYRLDVSLDARGRIERASLAPTSRRDLGDGNLSWLGMAVFDHEQVVAATIAPDGVVTLELDDGSTVPLTAEAGDDYVGC